MVLGNDVLSDFLEYREIVLLLQFIDVVDLDFLQKLKRKIGQLLIKDPLLVILALQVGVISDESEFIDLIEPLGLRVIPALVLRETRKTMDGIVLVIGKIQIIHQNDRLRVPRTGIEVRLLLD